MSGIGIIANPASGKDIRRLVSYATTIDNQEKVNIVKRIVLAAQSLGVGAVWFMPDTFQIGWTVMEDLRRDGKLTASCRILDIPLTGSPEDTVLAAAEFERMGLGCCVVLGGDGTSRAAAKSLDRTPLLPLSTGTNNVYPVMLEGTVAGMAAAAAAILARPELCCIRDKRIEIFRNGAFADLALVDAVFSRDIWVGAKAIWNTEKLRRIIVTRCHPASIGFSAAAGCAEIVRPEDDHGLVAELGGGREYRAPVAAGILARLQISKVRRLPLDSPWEHTAEENCMIALDGERELRVCPGDVLSIRVTRKGPWRVLPEKTLEEVARRGLFRLP